MKTTVEFPDDLLRRAKAEAAARGMSLKALLVAALDHELSGGARRLRAARQGAARARRLLRGAEAIAERIAAQAPEAGSVLEQLLQDRRARDR